VQRASGRRNKEIISMEEWTFRARQGDSRVGQSDPTINEAGTENHVGSLRRVVAALLLFGCALLNNGCADDAFLPQPENLPPGQSAPTDDTPQPLQPPTDL
jgi:hypothetical protein